MYTRPRFILIFVLIVAALIAAFAIAFLSTAAPEAFRINPALLP